VSLFSGNGRLGVTTVKVIVNDMDTVTRMGASGVKWLYVAL